MSKATKKRFVTKRMEMDFVSPDEGQLIAKVLSSRGNNLHEVIDETGATYLASMPTKFRRTVYVRRGHFVVVEGIEEGDKVKAEIVNVLDTESCLSIDEQGKWPAAFAEDLAKVKRSSKRVQPIGTSAIDADMLPPSESEEETDDEEEDGEDEEEADDNSEADNDDDESENDVAADVYNPNRRVVIG